jgi:hypothetical protein
MSVDHETKGAIPADPDQEFSGRLRRAARLAKWRRLVSTRMVLGALILVAVGFGGGVLEAKHTGATSTSAARAGTGATRTGTTGGFGGAATTGTGNSATIGTVKLVDGSTIYLTSTDGSVVKVTTSGSTKLSVTATGKASELKAGSTIVVTGTTDASGDLKATAITQSGAAATGSTTGAGAPAGARPSGAPAG